MLWYTYYSLSELDYFVFSFPSFHLPFKHLGPYVILEEGYAFIFFHHSPCTRLQLFSCTVCCCHGSCVVLLLFATYFGRGFASRVASLAYPIC